MELLASPYEGVRFPAFLMTVVGSLRNKLGLHPENSNPFFMTKITLVYASHLSIHLITLIINLKIMKDKMLKDISDNNFIVLLNIIPYIFFHCYKSVDTT